MATPKAGYRLANGEKIPSVTTVLSRFKDSGGLIRWAYKRGRDHENLAMRNLPAPAHLHDEVGEAANAGTIAHDMIEHYILHPPAADEPYPLLPESGLNAPDAVIKRAFNSFHQFLKWKAQTRIEIVATEQPLVSEKHRYGGTLDAVGKDADGRIVLIDWKTSNAVYGDYLFQLAAYAMLLEECMPWYTPTGFHLLRVAKETADFAHHYYGELEQEKRGFLLMRELFDICAITEKRA